jgi:hypothetical protein
VDSFFLKVPSFSYRGHLDEKEYETLNAAIHSAAKTKDE